MFCRFCWAILMQDPVYFCLEKTLCGALVGLWLWYIVPYCPFISLPMMPSVVWETICFRLFISYQLWFCLSVAYFLILKMYICFTIFLLCLFSKYGYNEEFCLLEDKNVEFTRWLIKLLFLQFVCFLSGLLKPPRY